MFVATAQTFQRFMNQVLWPQFCILLCECRFNCINRNKAHFKPLLTLISTIACASVRQSLFLELNF